MITFGGADPKDPWAFRAGPALLPAEGGTCATCGMKNVDGVLTTTFESVGRYVPCGDCTFGAVPIRN